MTSLADWKRIRDERLDPDVSLCRPIAVIRVDPFNITFPVAAIETV